VAKPPSQVHLFALGSASCSSGKGRHRCQKASSLKRRSNMPSKSKKQHNFMEAVAHSKEFANKADVKQSVGKEFVKADDRAGLTKTHKGKRIKK
jgi:hypothetical protein